MAANKVNALRIKYTISQPNKYRGTLTYYARVAERGVPAYKINLNTEDEAVAKAWVRQAELALEMYNTQVALHGQCPDDIAAQVVRKCNASVGTTTSGKDKVKTVRDLAEEFAADCQRTGLRQTSVDGYVRALKGIFQRYNNTWLEPMPTMSEQTVHGIVDAFADCKDQSRKNYTTILRRFLQWYRKKYHSVTDEVIDEVPRVKCDRLDHVSWTMDEMNQIISHAPNEQVRLYWHLLAWQGCRNTELRLAKVSDLITGKITMIHLRPENTKGRKARDVVVSDTIVPEFVKHCIAGKKQSDYIFDQVPTTNSSRNAQLHRAIKQCGNIKYGSLHTFRHSCAFFWLRDVVEYTGGEARPLDIRELADLLGHANTTTATQYYIESQAEVTASAMANAMYAAAKYNNVNKKEEV